MCNDQKSTADKSLLVPLLTTQILGTHCIQRASCNSGTLMPLSLLGVACSQNQAKKRAKGVTVKKQACSAV